jgi:2-methylcitrate dehydratase PrpD
MTDPGLYTRTLAAHAAETGFEQLTPGTVWSTKRLVLDTVGCAVGGRHVPSSEIVAEVTTLSGGKEQSTILVTGERVPVVAAAAANSHFANALDAEETILHSGHLAASVVPPALAVAEWTGSSGRDIVAAVAVGFDVAARIGLSCKQLDVTADGTVEIAPVGGLSWAAFGAAAVTGRLLGLSAVQMEHAIGITAASAPMPIGGRWGQLAAPRPMTKYGMYSTMSTAGVTAALLAERGFEGDRTILDGDRGFWRMMGSRRCDWNALTDRLGERFMADETSYKLFPACHWGMPALDLFDRLMTEARLTASEIDAVDILVPDGAITKFMDTADVRTVVDGQFSIPHMIALAAVYGTPGPHWHTTEAILDPRLREFAGRVRVTANEAARPEMHRLLVEQGHCEIIPTVVTVHSRGRSWHREADHAHGDGWAAGSVATDADLREKTRRFCRPMLPVEQVDRCIALIEELDSAAHVAPLIDALVARRP